MTGSLDGRAGNSLLLITTGTVALMSISGKKKGKKKVRSISDTKAS